MTNHAIHSMQLIAASQDYSPRPGQTIPDIYQKYGDEFDNSWTTIG
jgi:hypothetical protein